METNVRSIQLSLRKPFFENYLRHVFCSPEGPVKVTRTEEIGKYIYSRVRYSELPKKGKPGVELIMPHHECDLSQYYFIHFTEDDVVRINDYLEAMLYLDFRSNIQVGSNDMKINRKTIISIFSNLVFGEDKFEMLKKDEYRRRKKMEEWLMESVQKFGY